MTSNCPQDKTQIPQQDKYDLHDLAPSNFPPHPISSTQIHPSYFLLTVGVCILSGLVVSNSVQPHQAPLSMGLPRQEYWSGLPFPFLGNLPGSEIEPLSPALAGEFFTTEPPGKPITHIRIRKQHKPLLFGFPKNHISGTHFCNLFCQPCYVFEQRTDFCFFHFNC